MAPRKGVYSFSFHVVKVYNRQTILVRTVAERDNLIVLRKKKKRKERAIWSKWMKN